MSNNSSTLTNSWGSTLTVLEDCIKLEHKGASAVLLGLPRGEKTLFYDDFTSVEFKAKGLLSNGYIQFNVPGHRQNTNNPAFDEYSFAFDKKIEKQIRCFYERILAFKKSYRSSNDTTIVNQVSAADEILKLKQLLDSGVLTQDEFDAKKKQLLGL